MAVGCRGSILTLSTSKASKTRDREKSPSTCSGTRLGVGPGEGRHMYHRSQNGAVEVLGQRGLGRKGVVGGWTHLKHMKVWEVDGSF